MLCPTHRLKWTMRIRRIDIENFRGIRAASWRLPVDRNFFVFIGPGDSTKTTVLTAIEWCLHGRAGLSVLDTDFYGAQVQDAAIRIRVAVVDLPDELIAMDALGGFLAGIDENGEWFHDPIDATQRCVIVELLVEADLEPVWQSYRPALEEEEEEPHPIRVKHRSKMTAYRIDDRVDAHLRWSRTSSLGKLTASRGDTKATLTLASRAARKAAGEAITKELTTLAIDVKNQVEAIGTAQFSDLKPGLDFSLTNTQGNLALFEGEVPLTNFGLGTRRLTGVATQQLANEGTTTLLVDEVEHGLEPHRLVHLLRYLRKKETFSQVFVTTHSPTVLRQLEPKELVMVRSTHGVTELNPLDDPAGVRLLLKGSPEAFLARRIVINEGKTEYGVVLELLEAWDHSTSGTLAPSAALGVVAIEGSGGTGSAGWAKGFRSVGYDVVLFMDSDEPVANALIPEVTAAGGVVVQWADGHCIETAICDQLDETGLNAFIQAGLSVADDPDAAKQSFTANMTRFGAPTAHTGADPLDVTTWNKAGVTLEVSRQIVGNVAKKKDWFKRVDKGRRLGRFILETGQLQSGTVWDTITQLRNAIYASLQSVDIDVGETEIEHWSDPGVAEQAISGNDQAAENHVGQ